MSKDNNKANEGKQAAEQAAQHLANLLGRSVAGYTPSSNAGDELPPQIDLNTELFKRRNVSIASLVVIAGLLRANRLHREAILQSAKPEFFWEKSFDRFLYERIRAALREHNDISMSDLEACIQEYEPAVYGQPANEHSLQGHRSTLVQILKFQPTPAQIERAIELRRIWAKGKGLIDDK